MRKLFLLAGFLWVAVISFAQKNIIKKSFDETVNDNNRVAFKLYNNLKNTQDNFLISPYTLSSSFFLLYTGCKGETYKETSYFFKYDTKFDNVKMHFFNLKKIVDKRNDDDVQIYSTFALWMNKKLDIKGIYNRYSKRLTGDTVHMVDFSNQNNETEDKIDHWITETTDKKISYFSELRNMSDSTSIILTTAAFLKGNWQNAFGKISKSRFVLNKEGQKTRSIEYLTRLDYYRYAENERFQIIDVPFKMDSISIMFIVPKKGETVAEIQDELNFDNYQFWESSLASKQVQLYLPKFTIKNELNITQKLKDLGLKSMLSKNPKLGNMTDDKVRINMVLHKCVLEITEEKNVIATGTETDDLTAENMNAPSIATLVMNKPFVFVVKENKTGTILFIGHLVNPES